MNFRAIGLNIDIFDRCIGRFTLSYYTADRGISYRDDQVMSQMQGNCFNINRIGSIILVTAGPAADLADYTADARTGIVR